MEINAKKIAVWGLTGATAALCAGAVLVTQTWYSKPLKLEWFYMRAFASAALKSPEMMSQLRVLPGWLDFHSTRLDDESPGRRQEILQDMRDNLAMLDRYDRNALGREAQLSYDTLHYYLTNKIEGGRFYLHDFPVNQMHGLQSALPEFMADVHQVTTRGEAEDYIARLHKFPRKFEQLLELLRAQEAAGIQPPQFLVEKVLLQMHGFAGRPARENMLYTSFKSKLEAIPLADMDEKVRAELLQGAADAIQRSVYPAYAELVRHFVALQGRVSRNNGAWSLPNGEEYYAWCVRHHTSTNLTPQRVHELGLADVERVSGIMDRLLAEQGLEQGTVGERMQSLMRDPRYRFPDTEEGRKAMLAEYRAIMQEAEEKLSSAFLVHPKTAIEVRPAPTQSAATAPTAYYIPGALDGTRPGVFYANMRSLNDIPRFGMRSTVFHEVMPGHHFQVSLAQEMKGVPFFRRVISFSAYQEGWGLYAERLASEMGLTPQPLDQLGRLRDEMMRAVRLVVDTGIHYKRWSREEAIAYMVENTGMAPKEASVEVERYFVSPGQALAYKVGQLTILGLREHARRELGDKFDLKEFHHEILGHGALPMTVLERVVEDWIAKRQGH
ncbi:DUF885 family protein [Pseudoduganella sp. DS3]|uniref:DUF885 family protein n=1 Tax=Pseudoduganella guangdongensis TaxID=2692179 RepID=A0A6N9HFG6_9BURK|nr:DUF885 domain-containing protein [Pseudoduganella guangdongensis]MYN02186.1 DUF885 family protein [Pseudoduganella guangdongensis]